MFSRSKNKAGKDKPKLDENAKKERLKQFLIEVPEMPGTSNIGQDDDDEYDSDLEAELLALTQGEGTADVRQPPRRGEKMKNQDNFGKMVDSCIKDDDNFSDEDDPELLAELSALATEDEEPVVTPAEPRNSKPIKPEFRRPAPVVVRPSPMVAGPSLTALLRERKQMYEEAEKNALEAGESSRAKRFKRGLGTITQMLKAVEAGRAVNEEDIPPVVLVSSSRASSNVDLTETDVKSVPSSVSSPEFLSTDVPMLPSVSQHNNSNTNYGANSGYHKEMLVDMKNIGSSQSTVVLPSPTSAVLTQPVRRNDAEVAPGSKARESDAAVQHSGLTVVLRRQLEYKTLALEAKKKGDIEDAKRLLIVAKQMQPMVDAAKQGQEIDVFSLPPSPSSIAKHDPNFSVPQVAEAVAQAAPTLGASGKPLTTLEALQQRLAKYEQQRNKAKEDGNARKERMNQRIMKQYQEAITQVTTGRLMDFTELPTPPGFPPIPIEGTTPTVSPPAASPIPKAAETVALAADIPQADGPKPKQLKPNPVSAGSSSKVQATTPNVRNAPKSRVERQLSVLQKRQQLFREAALESKKKGEIEQAKEYLRSSKGFDQLILATQGGLPVDINTAPIPPQEIVASFTPVTDFEVIGKEDCEIMPAKSAADMAVTYTKLEDDLISQIKMCARTREHFKAVGDVASANRFEQLILHSKKDLDSVRASFKRGDTPPKFHYETRSFTMIQCNTDLTDSDLEFVVVRGISYDVPNPKDVHTYVKVEFPYPTESPPQGKTEVVKESNCPEYNHKLLFSIDRKSRSVSRIFKRQTIKCQVINKGSWYHRDNVLGSVKIPLIHLENKCTHHESYDLVDDRKKMVGGKLEVKVRVRNPILTKQLEKISEKWLVIDGF